MPNLLSKIFSRSQFKPTQENLALFDLTKKILSKIHRDKKLVDLKPIKKEHGLLVAEYIKRKGKEQEFLEEKLKKALESYKVSEHFLHYILWIAGETMNNVFDHAQVLGKVLEGGILLARIRYSSLILVVGDLGIGIKASLEKNPKIQKKKIDAKDAIKLSLEENVSGWLHKRGNGLTDIERIVRAGKGQMIIYSDQMIYKEGFKKNEWEIVKSKLPGVILGLRLKIHDFSLPKVKKRPKGKVFKLKNEGRFLSGREKGQEVYEKLVAELTKISKGGVLLIDLTEVEMINTSFGDQALGVLLENIKDGHFGAKKVFFIGEIGEAVNYCLERIGEIREVDLVRI